MTPSLLADAAERLGVSMRALRSALRWYVELPPETREALRRAVSGEMDARHQERVR